MDFSKAFDLVDYNLLLQELKAYGIFISCGFAQSGPFSGVVLIGLAAVVVNYFMRYLSQFLTFMDFDSREHSSHRVAHDRRRLRRLLLLRGRLQYQQAPGTLRSVLAMSQTAGEQLEGHHRAPLHRDPYHVRAVRHNPTTSTTAKVWPATSHRMCMCGLCAARCILCVFRIGSMSLLLSSFTIKTPTQAYLYGLKTVLRSSCFVGVADWFSE
ncbi:hypothetical protein L596_000517 [Steinernema carpocapsae]|uniref:Reverse transcriptase domain-containing protein n=1 Tax=Steinernema carpocapsae TaxID=34508 RepID=A0A4U8UIB1_STECR|nr:hypothetical protein L596_000517 [Steinernema carpocapsae]